MPVQISCNIYNNCLAQGISIKYLCTINPVSITYTEFPIPDQT